MSRTSGLELWIMVYSNGRRKSFWNLKCASSSFSKNRMANWRRASKAKNPTCGFLWQQTCGRIMSIAAFSTHFATYLVEVLAQNIPHVRPLQTDTVHVVVRDLHKLLQAEQPGVLGEARGLDLLPRDVTQRPNEVDNCRLQTK